MKEIQLANGKVAIVDDGDYEQLSQYSWSLSGRGYASREINPENGIRKRIYMHHDIIGNLGKGIYVDHINRNKLDNRRINLRHCTLSQNFANRNKQRNNTSGKKGVRWFARDSKWEAYIQCKGVRMYLGLFDDINKAADAYDRAAQKLFGEFACTNKDI